MKASTILKILFLSLLLSSCGLIEKFRTPEAPTDSSTNSEATPIETKVDDLFSTSMSNTENKSGTDSPSNITTNTNEENKQLESEFSSNGPADSQIKEIASTTPETSPATEPQKEENPISTLKPETSGENLTTSTEEKKPQTESQIKVEESIPEIKNEIATKPSEEYSNPEAGKISSYKVQKGETLMQIAFKIYGDIGKWKELKNLNNQIVSKNSSLKKGTEIKYKAPEKEFVWNPEGTAYLIKTGETLGIISNNVYQTPRKWKKIWENNRPLIKNPNIIYAGFTLYYKNEGMANYVQPKKDQPKKITLNSKTTLKNNHTEVINIEKSLSNLEQLDATSELQSSTLREPAAKIENEASRTPVIDQEIDEALIPNSAE